tara:strand:- start:246 stop:674 length:429 start_codon:yes stop_codon:yes gene_type:complete
MTRMTEKPEYNYSLINLQESLREIMESEITPEEIYHTIVHSVKKNMRYYNACYNDSVKLLALLKGNTNSSIKVHDNNIESGSASEYTENQYWNGEVPEQEFEKYLRKYGYEYTPTIDKSKFKLDSPILHDEEEKEEEENDIN